MKTCPECNGDGVIEKGTDDEQQCPTCGGSGFVPEVPCAVVVWREHMPPSKGTRVTTNMNFVRRSRSPLSSGRLYKTPVRRHRLSHARRKVDRGQRGEAAGIGAQVLAVLMRLCQEYRQIEKTRTEQDRFRDNRQCVLGFAAIRSRSGHKHCALTVCQ